MICKYCGSPIKPGETTCRKCGQKQDSMVQMEGFREELYIKETMPEKETGEGTGPESISVHSRVISEAEWNGLMRAVREERKKNRAFRRRTAGILFIVILLNIVLLASGIWLNIKISRLERSVQDDKEVRKEQIQEEQEKKKELSEEQDSSDSRQDSEDTYGQQNPENPYGQQDPTEEPDSDEETDLSDESGTDAGYGETDGDAGNSGFYGNTLPNDGQNDDGTDQI